MQKLWGKVGAVEASGGTVTDTSCDDVRGAFEAEHPQNMVDASDAYALSVFPFGREDKKTLRVSTVWVVQ